MHVNHLSLANFRSYPELELSLTPGVTVLVGPNGHGKTNIVEAIGYLSTLGSHRVATEAPLVRQGCASAVVRAAVTRSGRSCLLEVELTPGRANRAKRDRSPLPRVRDILGTLRTVVFAPEDLALVRGEPAVRRKFADDLLVLLSPRYAAVRGEYEKVLRQRGALLRKLSTTRRLGRSCSQSEAATLDVWDAQLAHYGADLLAARLYLMRRFKPHLTDAYRKISASDRLCEVGYQSGVLTSATDLISGDEALPNRETIAAQLLSAMERDRDREIERGICLVGPHRDDLEICVGDLPARGYASHGECWSVALALRLASYRLLTDEGPGDQTEREPVLILDDVFAELDSGRRDRLIKVANAAEQVLVTAAVSEDIPDGLAGNQVKIRNSKVSSDNNHPPSCG